MADDPYERLLELLGVPTTARIHSALTSVREAVMVQIVVPGQRWEVEFMLDGSVEVEKSVSDGTIHDASALISLLQDFSDG